MNPPSPSKLARVAICVGSECLPHVANVSRASESGRAKHDFIADVATRGRETALTAVPPEYRDACAAIDFDALPPLKPNTGAAEMAMAWDPETGAALVLGVRLSPEEARERARPGWMVGTADWVATTEDCAVVLDWKSGRGHVDAAASNWQARTYGLMAARATGKDAALVGIVRIPEDGEPRFDTARMDAIELDAHEAALLTLLERRSQAIDTFRTTGALPRLVIGEHCRYCPAAPACPARAGLALSLMPGASGTPAPLSAALAKPLGPLEVAELWPRVQAARKLLEQLEDACKDVARSQPVQLSTGAMLAPVEKSRTHIIGEAAAPVLVRAYGPEVAQACSSTEVRITQAALKAALREHVLPKRKAGDSKATLTALEREALDALRSAGALSVARYARVEEVPIEVPAKALPIQTPE